MSKRSNQNFVQIPFHQLQWNITYLAERYGVSVEKQEESYTSKASFLDGDVIPVYGKMDKNPVFSGKRTSRGVYRASNGTIINADLNGSANILRKAYGNAFENKAPLFQKTAVIRHPNL